MIVKTLHDRVHLGRRAEHFLIIGPYGFRIQLIEAQELNSSGTRNKSNTIIFK